MTGDQRRLVLLSLLPALCMGCGEAGTTQLAPLAEPPTRTAVQDRALRSLLVDAAESRLCQLLVGRFAGLPEQGAPSGAAAGDAATEGRLWVERCRAERGADQQLALHLEGRGWTWADERRQGPLGTAFSVKGTLRFRLQAELVGAIDLGYSESEQVLSLWYTPRQSPSARLELLGEIPVRPEGGWSGVIGAVGVLLGGPLEQQARPAAEQAGAALIASRLSQGLTATGDLCTGQVDTLLGALEDGQTPRRPFPAEGLRWIANERVRLRAGLIDAAGPWDAQGGELRFDLQAVSGPGFEVRALCEDSGQRVVEAFLSGRPAPLVTALAQHSIEHNRRTTFTVTSPSCPVVLVSTPSPQAVEPSLFLFRVARPEDRAQALVRCRSQGAEESGGSSRR